jgi:hypothetical protein
MGMKRRDYLVPERVKNAGQANCQIATSLRLTIKAQKLDWLEVLRRA